MAKSPAARKAAQRARQASNGEHKLELVLDEQELAMMDHDCFARRPGREPYDRTELVSLMIRKYHAELLEIQQALNKRQCGKCGDKLPVQDCCFKKEEDCWVSLGWHETKIKL